MDKHEDKKGMGKVRGGGHQFSGGVQGTFYPDTALGKPEPRATHPPGIGLQQDRGVNAPPRTSSPCLRWSRALAFGVEAGSPDRTAIQTGWDRKVRIDMHCKTCTATLKEGRREGRCHRRKEELVPAFETSEGGQ